MYMYVGYVGYNWTNDKDLSIEVVSDNVDTVLSKLKEIASEEDDKPDWDYIRDLGESPANEDYDRIYGINKVPFIKG